MNRNLKILITDDHELFSNGLAGLLVKDFANAEIEICGNAKELLHKVNYFKANLLLLDLNLPDINGVNLIYQIKVVQPNIKVIAITMHNSIALYKELQLLPFDGYILKNTSVEELVNAIHLVLDGERYFRLEDTKIEPNNVILGPTQLTKREIEILMLLIQGFTSKQISEVIFVSELTVETHRKNIKKKTNCKTIIELIQYAKSIGFKK